MNLSNDECPKLFIETCLQKSLKCELISKNGSFLMMHLLVVHTIFISLKRNYENIRNMIIIQIENNSRFLGYPIKKEEIFTKWNVEDIAPFAYSKIILFFETNIFFHIPYWISHPGRHKRQEQRRQHIAQHFSNLNFAEGAFASRQ